MLVARCAVLLAALPAGLCSTITDLRCGGLLTNADSTTVYPFPPQMDIPLSWNWGGGPLPSSFEVVISDGQADIWSSGMIPSSSPTFVLPAALRGNLAPGGTFRWRVQTTGPTNETLSISDQANLDIAPSPADWEGAEWIGGASQLRTDWTLGAPVLSARAYVAALGVFELHVNGQTVGTHRMDPGESVYDQAVLYVGFNITSLLRNGANAVGALLGNGKYGYLDIFVNRTTLGDQSGDSSRALKLIAHAHLADGSVATLQTTAAGWRTRHGPIVYDHSWHGEIYDARKEVLSPAWDASPLAAYAPDVWARSASAITVGAVAAKLRPQLMEPIRIIQTIKPVAVAASPASLVFDFGINLAGTTELTFARPVRARYALDNAEEVTIKLRIKHSEITYTNGSTYNNFYPGMEQMHGGSATCSMVDWYEDKWYECANQTDAYIFTVLPNATKAFITFTPTFTYHGFRFAELTAVELQLDGTEMPLRPELAALFPFDAALVAHQAHSSVNRLTSLRISPDVGGLAAGVLGSIFNATLQSHVSQLWSIPTDCPQREKRGYALLIGCTLILIVKGVWNLAS